MTTVYVVTSGCYSDYKIEAVFDNRDAAEAYSALFADYDRNDVEEYVLNAAGNYPQGMKRYWVEFYANGGINVSQTNPSSETGESLGRRYDGGWFTACWAKDEMHAVKIANERRAMAIANGTWN